MPLRVGSCSHNSHRLSSLGILPFRRRVPPQPGRQDRGATNSCQEKFFRQLLA
jgi:hypothetical protein